jgi:O-antigen biosynthesis protein
MPAVDTALFHPPADGSRPAQRAATLFVYGRPGHWRNCWELASIALEEVKRQLGSRIRIVTAGSWASAGSDTGTMEHLGLLDYRATGELYRRCDMGLALTVSKHPSYLPLELMACGVPVVAFDNPWGHWILEHERNSLLTPRTVDGLTDALVRLATDGELRARLALNAAATVQDRHADWDEALAGVYDALCDPEGSAFSPFAAVAAHERGASGA